LVTRRNKEKPKESRNLKNQNSKGSENLKDQGPGTRDEVPRGPRTRNPDQGTETRDGPGTRDQGEPKEPENPEARDQGEPRAKDPRDPRESQRDASTVPLFLRCLLRQDAFKVLYLSLLSC
jgi:hypothetical protein